MTSLQAEYSKLLEQRRHDIAGEELGRSQLEEDTRHHLRTEDQTDAANAITKWSKEVDTTLAREKMANDRQIAQLKAASDQLIQSMKGEIEQRKLDQYERELNASIAKMQTDAAATTKQAEAAYMKAESDRSQVEARNAASYAKALKDQTYAYANWKGTITRIGADSWKSAGKSFDELAKEVTGSANGAAQVKQQAANVSGLNPLFQVDRVAKAASSAVKREKSKSPQKQQEESKSKLKGNYSNN